MLQSFWHRLLALPLLLNILISWPIHIGNATPGVIRMQFRGSEDIQSDSLERILQQCLREPKPRLYAFEKSDHRFPLLEISLLHYKSKLPIRQRFQMLSISYDLASIYIPTAYSLNTYCLKSFRCYSLYILPARDKPTTTEIMEHVADLFCCRSQIHVVTKF